MANDSTSKQAPLTETAELRPLNATDTKLSPISEINHVANAPIPSAASAASRLRLLIVRFSVTIAVAIAWALATQFTKSALSYDQKRFYAPYTLVWFNTCFMSVCYPVYLVYARFRYSKRPLADINLESARVFAATGGFSLLGVLKAVLPFLLLWVAANYSFSQSLGRVSASAATSLMSSNAAMVCVLSALLLSEGFTVEKVLAVVFAIGGVVVISLDREFSGNWIGVSLVMFSAVSAAAYKVLFKRNIGNAPLGQISLFMSALGVLNVTLNFVPSAILVLQDVDYIEWDAIPWAPLCGSALLGLAFNFLVNFGIALLSPLIVSIGMLCGIPLSAAIDITFRHMQTTLTFALGTLLILVSFILSTIPLRQLVQDFRTKRSERNKADY